MNMQQLFADAFTARKAARSTRREMTARNARRLGRVDVLEAQDKWLRPVGARVRDERRDVPACELAAPYYG